MSDEAANTEATVTEAPATATKEVPAGQSDKVSTDSLWEDKVSRLNQDLHKERQELKKLRQEREELAKAVSDYTIKEKKSNALSEALSNLGEDFEVPSDKLPILNKLINKISDSESLNEDIMEAVSLVKTSKVKESQPVINSPFAGPAAQAQKDSKQMSAEDWMKMAQTNPDQFKKLYGAPFSR